MMLPNPRWFIPSVVLFSIFFTLIFASISEGAEIPRETMIRCIVGEAASEGLEGMTAVAEAIRNRGHVRGVYGCKAKFVASEPEWVFKRAEMALESSFSSNLTKGADHWESIDFPEPKWAKSMIHTATIKKHKFYKEVR